MLNNRAFIDKNILMFDHIARKYDLLNHILSFGQDIYWRKKIVNYVPNKSHLQILDLATGTADQLIILLKKCNNIDKAIGIDNAENMLEIAKRKLAKLNLNDKITLLKKDINQLELADNSIDMVTISFGIRNIPDFQFIIAEIYRILKTNGVLIILEFSLPKNRIIKKIYLFYFRKIMPKIGEMVSGNKEAYYYLNKSVEAFPYGKKFIEILKKAGFQNIKMKLLSLGIATIYCSEKHETNKK